MTAYCPLCNHLRSDCVCRTRTPLELEMLAALEGMQLAAKEIAAEFIEHKRATNWKVVNDAYVACAAAIHKAQS